MLMKLGFSVSHSKVSLILCSIYRNISQHFSLAYQYVSCNKIKQTDLIDVALYLVSHCLCETDGSFDPSLYIMTLYALTEM